MKKLSLGIHTHSRVDAVDVHRGKNKSENHNKLLNSTRTTSSEKKSLVCVFQAIQLNSNGKNCSDWRIYERPGANMMQQIWGSRERETEKIFMVYVSRRLPSMCLSGAMSKHKLLSFSIERNF